MDLGVLPDWRIRNLCINGAIKPFDSDLINPASIDVRLGGTILQEAENSGKFVEVDISSTTKEDPYLLIPNEFILAQTLEFFDIPEAVCCQFALKSSGARLGLEHNLAGWVDPGFHNSVLTLELKNARRFKPIALWYKMRIGQLIFFDMHGSALHSYRKKGHYNNDAKVTECKQML